MSCRGYRVVGYLSMSMTAVDFSRAPKGLVARGLSQVPALLCGRLAVDRRHRGLGPGTTLVEWLLSKALELNEAAACRAVVVHALDAEARVSWERFGFMPFDDDPGERDLYLLTKNVAATLQQLG